jgi:glycosyltransferase involved in cell wall biosynthesis
MVQITVIIPFRNCLEAEFIRAIDAVLNQTFAEFELMLVDDCSEDNCPAIAEEYVAKDARIKLIHNPERLGCPKSRENGLSQAQGEYILMCDADDYMEPNMLSELYSTISKNGADVAYCDYFRHLDGKTESVRQGEFTGKIPFIKSIFSKDIWGIIWNKLVRKSVFEKIIFPTYFHHEDEVQTIQLVSLAERVEYVPLPLYHYFDHTPMAHYHNIGSFVSSYHNYKIIVDFLQAYYEDIELFDPELRRHVNLIKYVCCSRSNDYPFTRKLLFGLYPQSNLYLFKSKKVGLAGKLLFLSALCNLRFLYYILNSYISNRTRAKVA